MGTCSLGLGVEMQGLAWTNTLSLPPGGLVSSIPVPTLEVIRWQPANTLA